MYKGVCILALTMRLLSNYSVVLVLNSDTLRYRYVDVPGSNHANICAPVSPSFSRDIVACPLSHLCRSVCEVRSSAYYCYT